MKLLIFESIGYQDEVPEGFNAVTVALDGGLRSDLRWDEAEAAAKRYVEQGYRIFWKMDLGLFSQLRNPLTNPSQFLSLKLSLHHFRDTLWREFKDASVGIALYSGGIDFTRGFRWDSEQEQDLKEWLSDKIGKEEQPSQEILQLYCRDAAAAYLDMLAAEIPYGLEGYLLLDASEAEDLVHGANLLSKDKYPHLSLAIKGWNFIYPEFSWEFGIGEKGCIGRTLPIEDGSYSPQIAVCLPSEPLLLPSRYGALRDAFDILSTKVRRPRLIPESLLTAEWKGLDAIVVLSDYVSPQGRRMLMGFCAAGGTVVCQGPTLGLAQEASLANFIDKI